MGTRREHEGAEHVVLVVDDHPRARDMLSLVIRLEGRWLGVGAVLEAATGEEALAMARVHRPDVVLMDIRLPGISGFEAARSIKEELPHVHIVMVTASEEPGDREELTRLGAAGFVTKDSLMEELVPILARTLGRPSTEA